MKRNFWFVMLLTIALLLGVGTVYAQSSGSFSYGYTGTTHCVLNNNGTGIISGAQCLQGHGPSCTSPADCISIVGTTCVIPQGATSGQCLAGPDNDQGCAGSIQAGIKTNSGSGNVFLIRPSAVIGLLTDVTVQKSSTIDIGTSSALAGVDFRVAVQSVANPDAYVHVIPDYAITYASRFVQISTNLFNVLGTLCTDVTGTNTFGVTTAVGCFISFNESTVSAHSFDWI